MAARNRRGIYAALVGAALLGCSSAPITHRTWDSLSEEELQTRLSSPTADLSLGLTAQQVSGLEARLPALVELSRFLGQVVSAVSSVAETDYSSEESRLPAVEEAPAESQERGWGTNLYLRIACPGADPDARATDFSAGEARLDSARLRSLDVTELLKGGEFLLSFERCQLGPMKVDADFPGRYTLDVDRLKSGVGASDAPALAIALSGDEVEQGSTAWPLGMIMVGCGGSGACDEDLRVAAEFRTGVGSFVVAFRALQSFWSGQGLSLSLAGRDTTAECEYTNVPGIGPRVTCETE